MKILSKFLFIIRTVFICIALATTTQIADATPINNSSDNSTQQLPVSAPPYILNDDPLIRKSTNKEDDICHLHNFRQKSGLFAIITGIEHSGTTMTSSLVMNAPNLYGAFESGMMLFDDTTKHYVNDMDRMNKTKESLFYKGLTAPVTNHFWGLSDGHRDEIFEKARCPVEQYNILRKHSPIYKSQKTEESWIIDKTPAYYHNLFSIMQRTPGVPVIVTKKEDEAVRHSLQKRGASNSEIERRLSNFHRELDLCRTNFPERLFVLDHTEFTRYPNKVMTDLFAFLGLKWDPSYLSNEALNKKGKVIGRPKIPGFDQERSACLDCPTTNPYGKQDVRTSSTVDDKTVVEQNTIRVKKSLRGSHRS
jgi:hypothetical protein